MYVQAYILTMFSNISIMSKVEFQEHEYEKMKSGKQEMSFSRLVLCWLLKFKTQTEIDYYYDLLKCIL